jgi:hypothetical protein
MDISLPLEPGNLLPDWYRTAAAANDWLDSLQSIADWLRRRPTMKIKLIH